MLWKFRAPRSRFVTAPLKDHFRFIGWNDTWTRLVTQYDLKMWYMANSPDHAKSLQYT